MASAGTRDTPLLSSTSLRRTKRPVDRKASKGRKVSYEVHAKLHNFMNPRGSPNRSRSVAELFNAVLHQGNSQGPGLTD